MLVSLAVQERLRDSQTLFGSRQITISFALAAPNMDSAVVSERADPNRGVSTHGPNKSRDLLTFAPKF
jgi:hypothetical protein